MSDTRRFDFYARVAKGDENACWPFLGSKTTAGYGCFRFDGRQQMAHRVSYQLAKGPIPSGLLVCHTCDNPPCVNPSHLFLGDHAANNRDARDKGRAAFGDRNGARTHPEALRRGAANSNSKINESDVRQMRWLYLSGWLQSEIAEMFSVNQTVAGDAIRGRTWAHVTDPPPAPQRPDYRSEPAAKGRAVIAAERLWRKPLSTRRGRK